MSRGALFLSLGVHAGLLMLVGKGWLSVREPRASEPPEVATASLLVEAAPTEPSEPASLPGEPALHPPALSLEVSIPLRSESDNLPFPLPVAAGLVPSLPRPLRPASERSTRAAVAPSGQRANRPPGATAGASSSLSEEAYEPPRYRRRDKPPYPPAARAQRLEGTVLLLVSLDPAGRVTGVEVKRTCGHLLLDRAALDAVRSWRFEPARWHGVPTASHVEVPVGFRLS